MLAAARPGLRRTLADVASLRAPTIRVEHHVGDYGPGFTGDRTYALPSAPQLGDQVLAVISHRPSAVNGVDGFGSTGGWQNVYTWAADRFPYLGCMIAWLPSVTSTSGNITVHWNGSFSIDIATLSFYVFTDLPGKSIIDSHVESTQRTVTNGDTFGASLTATAAEQLFVLGFTSHDDENSDPTWIETPSSSPSAWTHYRDSPAVNNSLQTLDFVVTGGAGAIGALRDYPLYSGSGMYNAGAAALIG